MKNEGPYLLVVSFVQEKMESRVILAAGEG